jgi:hypothetical protein
MLIVVLSGCARVGQETVQPSPSHTPEPSARTSGWVCPGTIPEPGASVPPPDSDERYGLTADVEALTDGLRAKHGDWIDIFWVEHEPDFQLVMRVAQGTSREELCALVDDWPIVVVVQPPAAHTYAELARGAKILSDMWVSANPLFAALEDLEYLEQAELYADPRTASVRIGSSRPLSDEVIAKMSEIAGVPVTFELLEKQTDYWSGLPPECNSPWARCRR